MHSISYLAQSNWSSGPHLDSYAVDPLKTRFFFIKQVFGKVFGFDRTNPTWMPSYGARNKQLVNRPIGRAFLYVCYQYTLYMLQSDIIQDRFLYRTNWFLVNHCFRCCSNLNWICSIVSVTRIGSTGIGSIPTGTYAGGSGACFAYSVASAINCQGREGCLACCLRCYLLQHSNQWLSNWHLGKLQLVHRLSQLTLDIQNILAIHFFITGSLVGGTGTTCRWIVSLGSYCQNLCYSPFAYGITEVRRSTNLLC